ncbi:MULTISPECIES: putative bifunctional diguanylate cyclase/phosphodiesterase [Pseudomonas]|uniref:putative bifunctional diguanylate cyclase/phosphodiesterase n=1 Tax=Pseudomonas TaxID=286 RepID=UPI000493A908|nr:MULTISPECIES: EAL domain-containing protein [Pseudomonas]NMZ20927.1 EAL domain-containing protein [Pseudomonas proteolytica]NMZ36712.1 EAL domain-containing protein [Pseudomonas proteolytica]NMZ41735.1 EAL domain-containing protein [Pseudomonas proteolytica]OHW41837.1 two-component system response regulator [Pseudomonas sp. 06C 126]QJI18037.1 EAL domain-containing protein [Pseudomonas sp. ADAK21]
MESVPTLAEGSSVLLVVDDYPENLISMRALLQREDWQVLTAGSGEEALGLLLARDVDLVLLDVRMPGMDGFEVARLMRGSQRTRMTPIIFLSATEQSPAAVLEGYASGAIDYLFKPFDPHILKPKVQALLEHQRNRRALQRLSHDLEAARAFNASVLDNAAEGILVVGEDGVVSYANPAISRLLNATVDELQGQAFLGFLQKPHMPDWFSCELYTGYLRGETWRLHDAILRTAPGQQLPVAMSCAPLPREQKAMVVTVQDMSQVRHLHQQLESQAVTDPLTGLLNRRGFYQTVETILLRNERSEHSTVLLYMDLDGFKRVNDSVGHDAGDRVLRWVSEQLELCLRSCDILGRLGGDEFVALLELEYPEQAAKLAEQLIERVSICQQVDGLEVMLGVSIGIATFPDCGRDLSGLLRAADIAMYEAKRAGRQQYRYYDQEMNGRARSRLMLESSVREAIDNKQVTLVYQPQVSLLDGHLRGVEALLRWQHPSVGDVPPGLFMPLLEEARLISQLSSWIYHQVALARQAWASVMSDDWVLSVSLSSSQFNMPNLAPQLQQAMERHGLHGRQLEVEIAEESLMHNIEESIKQLKQLRRLGVRIALDDFGLGNCSLAHLRDLEFDTLKLDPGLVARVLGSPREAALARSIIELCGHFGLLVIAEGVETLEQCHWLQANGCQFIQGPLVALPLTAEDISLWPQPFALRAGPC